MNTHAIALQIFTKKKQSHDFSAGVVNEFDKSPDKKMDPSKDVKDVKAENPLMLLKKLVKSDLHQYPHHLLLRKAKIKFWINIMVDIGIEQNQPGIFLAIYTQFQNALRLDAEQLEDKGADLKLMDDNTKARYQVCLQHYGELQSRGINLKNVEVGKTFPLAACQQRLTDRDQYFLLDAIRKEYLATLQKNRHPAELYMMQLIYAHQDNKTEKFFSHPTLMKFLRDQLRDMDEKGAGQGALAKILDDQYFQLTGNHLQISKKMKKIELTTIQRATAVPAALHPANAMLAVASQQSDATEPKKELGLALR